MKLSPWKKGGLLCGLALCLFLNPWNLAYLFTGDGSIDHPLLFGSLLIAHILLSSILIFLIQRHSRSWKSLCLLTLLLSLAPAAAFAISQQKVHSVISTEEQMVDLAPTLVQLERDFFDLQIPGHHSRNSWAASVTAIDLAVPDLSLIHI